MKAPSRKTAQDKAAPETKSIDTAAQVDSQTSVQTQSSAQSKVSSQTASSTAPRTRKAPSRKSSANDASANIAMADETAPKAARKRAKAPSRNAGDSKTVSTDNQPDMNDKAAASKDAKPKKSGKSSDKTPTFSQLGLDPRILRALDDLGYETPTPIQAESIPHALQNKDILGIAQTGTGKTGAFTLPVMHRMAKGRARARMPRCLVICPTRELAAQVAENVELYGKYLKLEMALLIGGVSFAEQDAKLSKGVDILIATPGRLLDQFERGKMLLTGVQTLVVDEADRMLDMGFIPDIERIFEITPFTRQVLFFSATMAPEITRIVDTFLHQPVRVEVARQSRTADTVTQSIITMPSNDSRAKRNALRGIIEQSEVKNGIIFCNRKRDVDIVAKSLSKHGYQAQPIHGDLPQSERMKTLQAFRDGELKLLVASDVAARGLDVPDVSHVLNFDVPSHSEDYVHRIGRTGRAGRKGDTIMLVTPSDEKNFEAVKRLIEVKKFNEFPLKGVSLDPDVRDSDKRHRNKDRNKGQSRGDSRGRRNDRPGRDRPVKDHGQVAGMAPVAKNKARAKPAKSSESADKQTPDKKAQESKRRENGHNSERSDANKENRQNNRQEGRTEGRQDNKRQNTSKRDDSQTANKGRNQNQDKPRKRYKNELPASDKAGFGNDMPAFFGNSLK